MPPASIFSTPRSWSVAPLGWKAHLPEAERDRGYERSDRVGSPVTPLLLRRSLLGRTVVTPRQADATSHSARFPLLRIGSVCQCPWSIRSAPSLPIVRRTSSMSTAPACPEYGRRAGSCARTEAGEIFPETKPTPRHCFTSWLRALPVETAARAPDRTTRRIGPRPETSAGTRT